MLLLMGEVTILFVVVAAYELYAGILGVYAVLIGENIIFVETSVNHQIVDIPFVVEAVDYGLHLSFGTSGATHIVEYAHGAPKTGKHSSHVDIRSHSQP